MPNVTPETITVTVPGAQTGPPDDQGNPTFLPPVVTTPTIKAFAPRPSSEVPTDYGVTVFSGGVVYGYRGTEIPPNAILTIRGDEWLMDGETGDWKSPYHVGHPDGVEFAVKRRT